MKFVRNCKIMEKENKMFIKRKEFEELKNRVEVLEFQRDNPSGFEIQADTTLFYTHYNLRYIKDNEIKSIKLPPIWQSAHYELCEGNLIIEKDFDSDFYGGSYKCVINKKYKFDIANELLIELQEPQKEEKPKKKSVKGKTKVAKNKQKR